MLFLLYLIVKVAARLLALGRSNGSRETWNGRLRIINDLIKPGYARLRAAAATAEPALT